MQKKIMKKLAKENKTECLLFEAIEKLDYILYAIEQYLERGNRKILVQVVRNQSPHMDKLASEIPGFRENVWTGEFSGWCKFAAENNNDIAEEKKGEK